MSHDTLLDLSRWQWALTAAFHITFPAVTVGTSVFLVVCYAMYMRTDDDVWLRMFRFWRRIFTVGFTIGVVSGIVLTFEFGLNWGPFTHLVGPIVGVAILMEVVMAFFLRGRLPGPADLWGGTDRQADDDVLRLHGESRHDAVGHLDPGRQLVIRRRRAADAPASENPRDRRRSGPCARENHPLRGPCALTSGPALIWISTDSTDLRPGSTPVKQNVHR